MNLTRLKKTSLKNSYKAPSCINTLHLKCAAACDQIKIIIQVDAEAYIYRNNTQALAHSWRRIAAADINPAVFFVQTGYHCIGVFNDIAHLKVFKA